MWIAGYRLYASFFYVEYKDLVQILTDVTKFIPSIMIVFRVLGADGQIMIVSLVS